MKIDEILFKLNYEIERETGIKNAVHTVIFSHEGFDRSVIELFRTTEYGKYSYNPASISDCTVAGVRILAREVGDLRRL
jgi:hypothetical protein